MSTSPSSTPPRREFLGQLAVTAVALAGTACAGHPPLAGAAAAAAAGSAPAPSASPHWDDGWTSKLAAKHRAVFDAPAIAEGTVVTNAFVYMKGFTEVYGLADADVKPVLVIRHKAIPLALDDAMWEKYELGKENEVKDPATGEWARRNPYLKSDPSEKPGPWAGISLERLHQRGAVLIGCNVALDHMTERLAARTKQDASAVGAELRAHLVPGLDLAPSGVFAVMRAQEAGCAYIRSA